MSDAAASIPPSPDRIAKLLDPSVKIELVMTPAQQQEFLEFPYEIYRDDAYWVAPLLMERRDFLDRRKNPFFKHATAQLFLAKRNGKVVGRISACEDKNYNAFHGEKLGFWGMFECIDDPAVAAGLYDAARSWISMKGLTRMLGPASFNSNHDWGLLVDGFDSPPSIMMPYMPRYYTRLLEQDLGLPKVKDLWAWWLDATTEPPEKVVRIAEKVRQKEGIIVRPVNLKDFQNEARRIKDVYNAAWEKNWGFVPFTDEEFDHTAKDMRTVAKADLVLIAEVQGEPVAFSMTLPDMNQALIHVKGRLTQFGLPIGLGKLLYYSNQVNQLRLITLGIKEKYRKRGIDAILFLDTLRAARRLGYRGGEISWTLEDNHLVNRAIEMMGGKKTKTYRLYETEV